MLKKNGVRHNVLNAVNHEAEASIIAQAGRFAGVTIATNMAGRGTDILLGGNPEFLARSDMENEWISRASKLPGQGAGGRGGGRPPKRGGGRTGAGGARLEKGRRRRKAPQAGFPGASSWRV